MVGFKKDNCLICGNTVGQGTLKINDHKRHSKIFALWKNECSTAFCEILMGNDNAIFHSFLQRAEFCHSCHQIVRDLSLLWKQEKSIQNRIRLFSSKIRNRLDSNYSKLENKSEENVINEKVAALLQNSSSKASQKTVKFSYEEIVELIYAASFSQSSHTVLTQNGLSQSHPAEKVKDSEENSNAFYESTKFETIKMEIVEDAHSEDADWQIESSTGSPNDDENATRVCRERKHRSDDNKKNHIAIKKESKADNNNEDDYEEEDGFDTASLESADDYKERTPRRAILRKICPTQKSKRGRKPKQNVGNYIMKSRSDKNTRFYCEEESCESSFTTELKLQVHVLKFHKGEKKPYHCTRCPKKFSLKNVLVRHNRDVHQKVKKDQIQQIDLKYFCSFCGKKYLNEEDLTEHYSGAHQEPNPFQCAFCTEIYTNCVDLKKHTRELHPNPEKASRSVCDICGKSFGNKYSLKYHLRLHGDPSLLHSCTICGMKFAIKTWLTVHMEKHAAKKYKCDKCGKFFPHLHNLKRHEIYNHLEKYECRICGETLPTLGKWERHEIAHKDLISNKIKRSKVKINTAIECKFCAKSYQNEEELNIHYTKAHQGSNPFSCGFCPEFYSNSFDLRNHMKTNHPEPSLLVGKIKCDSCDRYFSTKQGLKNHSVVHGDPSLLHRCHLCDKVFIHRNFLKKHLVRHTAERNCICETCGKGFKNMDDLKSHLRHHDASAKKFQCNICDRKFTTSEQCKRHETTHTSIKEFSCDVCGKSFNVKGNLTQHCKMHTGDGKSHIRRRKPKPSPNVVVDDTNDNFIGWNMLEDQNY